MAGIVISRIIISLWIFWLIGWLLAARHVKPTRWEECRMSRMSYSAPSILALLLLAVPSLIPPLRGRFLPIGIVLPVIGALLTAAGLVLAFWARWHLGRNWSSIVMVKDQHTLIRTGPYRVVRHPIYTGLLIALAGTALAIGEWRALLALALMLGSLLRKMQLEEERMRLTFPEYTDYCRHSWALFPPLF
ncbi:MAG TPA: isoprenylcysteine carboxylmethyltransferase family protein [Stellaceae bacterium]|nr:isoprenylcysteine carboxylmethyltransferase family protein [Stellaceae bacterium]